jgi:hypothetical protein
MSWFIVLVPCWLLLIYICAFMIIVGLASTNTKVNQAERLVLSLCVPLGFLASTILAVCYIDKYITTSLGYLFLPQLGSFIMAYLYIRCLVKPSGHKV